MAIPAGSIEPLRDFIAANLRLAMEDYRKRVKGPLLLCRLVGNRPVVIDLGKIMLAGQESVLLGRAANCDLQFANSNVSSNHARLVFEAGEWWLHDLKSTNGTFAEQPLKAGERVKLREKCIYSLAEVVEIEFWGSERLFQELGERVKKARTSQRFEAPKQLQPEAAPPPTGVGQRSTRRFHRSQVLETHNGFPSDLRQFALRFHQHHAKQFVTQFPHPFLILLSTTKSEIEQSSPTETIGAEQLIVQRSMAGLKFWPIRPRKEQIPRAILGRAPECDLILRHQTISKHHGLFSFEGTWSLQDLDSMNGVFFDGLQIDGMTRLEDEVCIRFGKEVLTQFMLPKSFHNFIKLYAIANELK